MVAEIQRENGNGYRGPISMDFSLGRKKGYTADIYSRATYEEKRDELNQIATELVVRSGLWTSRVAREMMARGIDASAGHKTSMIFFRKSDVEVGKYIGFTWQEIFPIPTNEGEIPLLYLRLRAIEERHQGKHLGTAGVQLALLTHDDANWFAHRTQSPAAAWSVIRSGIFRERRLYPWDTLYGAKDDSSEEVSRVNRLAQAIMVGLFMKVRVNGTGVEWSTGVSTNDYLESNMAYKPDLTHAPTMEIRRRMQEELGMDLQGRDSLYIVGQLK